METPDDLYGNRVKFTNVLCFSSPFTNARTRHSISSSPFLDTLMNHLRESCLGKQSKIKVSKGIKIKGVEHPGHRTLALQHI